MNSTVFTIIELVFNVAVIAIVLFPIVKLWIKTKGKFIEFVTCIIKNVAAAELTGATGAEKLKAVEEAAIEWCELNSIKMTEKTLERLINLVVASANLIKKFIKKG